MPSHMPWLKTVNAVLNDAAVECGFDPVSDAYAAADAHFVQLRYHLKSCGQELLQTRDWSVLVKEGSFAGNGTDVLFSMPADFARYKDGSGWDRAGAEPFSGPLSSGEWQYLKAWTAAASVTVYHRMIAGKTEFYTAIPNGETYYYDYVSRYWVAATASDTADKYEPSASTDVVIFEGNLAVKMLKWKFLEAKGKPGAAHALEEYRTAYENAAAQEPARVLSIGGAGRGFRFLDAGNLPDTGFGT